MSGAPHLVQDVEQNQRQTAPNKHDRLLTIAPYNRHIVVDVWIAIEKLMSPAEDGNAAEQKNDHRDGEGDA